MGPLRFRQRCINHLWKIHTLARDGGHRREACVERPRRGMLLYNPAPYPHLTLPQLLTPSTTTIPAETLEPTIYSGLHAQSDLHLIANSISHRLLRSPPISAEEALTLNKSLETWAVQVPSYFQPSLEQKHFEPWYLLSRSRLWWRYWNFQIILFRSILFRTAVKKIESPSAFNSARDEAQCRNLCVKSAHETIESIKSYTDLEPVTRLAGWYCLYVMAVPPSSDSYWSLPPSRYFLFHATMIPCVCIRADPNSPDAVQWRADIETARLMLSTTFSDNSLAGRALEVIQRVFPQPVSHFDLPIPQRPEDATIDFSLWPFDSTDSSSMGWLDFGGNF